MTERSRPPGLDAIAGDGLKLGARLAVGLLAVPLMGLALLAPRRRDIAGEAAPAAEPRPEERQAVPEAVETGPGPEADRPAAEPGDGPAQAEVETALRKLTDATIAKAGAVKKTGKTPRKASAASPKRAGKRDQAERAAPSPGDHRVPP